MCISESVPSAVDHFNRAEERAERGEGYTPVEELMTSLDVVRTLLWSGGR
jgi:hypothetical protein